MPTHNTKLLNRAWVVHRKKWIYGLILLYKDDLRLSKYSFFDFDDILPKSIY